VTGLRGDLEAPAEPRVLPYGRRAILIEVEGAEQVAALRSALADHPPAGTLELVPAARTVLLRFDPSRTDPQSLRAAIGALRLDDPRASSAAPAPPVRVPVVYDGADLDAVAGEAGLSIGEVIERHSAPEYVCAFCGFAPGFSYLIGGDPRLAVARLAEPRARVPAGAVAIAGGFSAVYPAASPGGWRLLGGTSAAMWDLSRAEPALAPPGARVRFDPIRAAVRGSLH
jgi:KipI family sensor histidine kinase inhibitor